MGFVQRFLSRMGDVWAKGRVQEDDCVYSPRLGDLPQDLVAVVLSLTTPKDIARLACVSRVCRDASKADFVWLKMLPPRYADILGQTPEDAPSSTSSKKDVFNYLATGRILLENGTEDFWLDRESGGVCRSFGARWLALPETDRGGWHPHPWQFGARDGARFAETAYVMQICGLQMGGNVKCFLPPGIYVLSWRLAFLKNTALGFFHPVKFSFETSDNEKVHLKTLFSGFRDDMRDRYPYRPAKDLYDVFITDDNWLEIVVGEFTVGRDDLPIAVDFSLTQLNGGIERHVYR